MRILLSMGVCVMCAAAMIGSAVIAVQPEPPVKPTVEDMKKHMEAMAAIGQPGPANRLLEQRAGSYSITIRMWMDGNDRSSPPLESTGEATLRAVLGGRFLMQDETATLAGEKITSIKYWGYSKDTQEYEAVWSYTGSTTMMILKGKSTDEGKTVRYRCDTVVAGQKERYDIVVSQLTPESFSIELVGIMENGAKGAALLSTYVRKK